MPRPDENIPLNELKARVDKCVNCGDAEILYGRDPTFENLCRYATSHRGIMEWRQTLPNLTGAQVFICMRYMNKCRRMYYEVHQSVIDSIWMRYRAIVCALAIGKFKRTQLPYDIWKIIARKM
jgi:ferredoxin